MKKIRRKINLVSKNALANSQREELEKFLNRGFDGQEPLVSYARYTGQESEQERERILKHPPDILLTNYVMLELILTRIDERRLVEYAGKLRFLVFDEMHTYRGVFGSHMANLIRRLLRVCRFYGSNPVFILCSATIANPLELKYPRQEGALWFVIESSRTPSRARKV